MSERLIKVVRELLDFARCENLEDLEADDSGRVNDYRKTIKAVAAQVGHFTQRKPVVAARLSRGTREEWVAKIDKDLPWSKRNADRSRTCKQLGRLQTTLNERLAALYPIKGFGNLPGGTTTLPVRVRRLHLQRQNAGEGAPVEMLFITHGWRDAFWLSVSVLLEEFGDKLRRCPVCTAVYLKTGRQAYCSPDCSNRKRQKDFQDRKRTRKLGRRKR